MHSATDRDNFVTVNWDNIIEDQKHNFNKFPENEISHYGASYDFTSLMHYPKDAFSKNGLPTIETNVN